MIFAIPIMIAIKSIAIISNAMIISPTSFFSFFIVLPFLLSGQ